MDNIFPIFKKELRSYYFSIVAYAVTSAYLFLMSIFFYSILKNYTNQSFRFMNMQRYNQGQSFDMNLTQHVLGPMMGNMHVIMLFLIPLLTMRIFAEEKKSGTIELLFTYPLKDWATILGKYLAVSMVFITMIVLTLAYPIFLISYGSLEMGTVFSTYLGIILMGIGFISFGIFCSSLSENQIVAAGLTFVGGLFFWIIGWVGNTGNPVLDNILSTVSFFTHFENFAKGLIDTSDFIYYILFAFFCLFLTSKVLESNKWRG